MPMTKKEQQQMDDPWREFAKNLTRPIPAVLRCSTGIIVLARVDGEIEAEQEAKRTNQ